jgi:hypothetical protein
MLAKTHVFFFFGLRVQNPFFFQTTNVVKHHKLKEFIGSLDTFPLISLGDTENYHCDVKHILTS